MGIAIRLILLPTEGLRGDLDQFVGWVHHIATEGLGTLYGGTDAGPVTFGPVMAYVWAVLAFLDPAFATATDASDVGVRVAMKLPATLADLGLAALVIVALRDRPRWAVAGAALVLLVPVTWYVSAWWGQYESIYVLSALAATICAIRGRNDAAALLIAVSLMTKPQAVPLLLPFAAWFWATGGLRGTIRATVIGLATIVVLWLPFIPYGGPTGYLANLATYQNEIFAILSLRAWNVWWLVQEAAAGGAFIADDVAFVGPLTLRHVGYALTGALWILTSLAVLRQPSPRTFILALAASVLVFFTWMTQMHERYAHAAVILLVLLIEERRARWLWIALAVVLTLNLVAAVPPTPEVAALLPISGPLGVAGSIAMIGITVAAIVATRRASSARPDHRVVGAGT